MGRDQGRRERESAQKELILIPRARTCERAVTVGESESVRDRILNPCRCSPLSEPSRSPVRRHRYIPVRIGALFAAAALCRQLSSGGIWIAGVSVMVISPRAPAVCLAAVLLPSVLSDAGIAQSPSISGRVVDAIGRPIAGVSVMTIQESGGNPALETTGSDGTYQFKGLRDGSYRIDFQIQWYDVLRRNHVRVRANSTAVADATLTLSAIDCECVNVVPPTSIRERVGQVADESDRPLAHARLQIVTPTYQEVAFADSEGRFRVRVPVNKSWSLTASDSGFGAVTQQVSGDAEDPVTFRLPRSSTMNLPDIQQLNNGGCRCTGGLFTHDGR
jgi:Carboxypeptidase regulatory-like domain